MSLKSSSVLFRCMTCMCHFPSWIDEASKSSDRHSSLSRRHTHEYGHVYFPRLVRGCSSCCLVYSWILGKERKEKGNDRAWSRLRKRKGLVFMVLSTQTKQNTQTSNSVQWAGKIHSQQERRIVCRHSLWRIKREETTWEWLIACRDPRTEKKKSLNFQPRQTQMAITPEYLFTYLTLTRFFIITIISVMMISLHGFLLLHRFSLFVFHNFCFFLVCVLE
jgi:hypothetical protein